MLHVLRTDGFNEWLSDLKDVHGRKQILARLTRLELGHWGDCKNVGGEVVELRLFSGPGYRIYCWRDGDAVVVVLGGGEKSTQQRDIDACIAMVESLKE